MEIAPKNMVNHLPISILSIKGNAFFYKINELENKKWA